MIGTSPAQLCDFGDEDVVCMLKNSDLFQVDENRIKQCCPVHLAHSCRQYCLPLLHLSAG
jgi:hypothetical protein